MTKPVAELPTILQLQDSPCICLCKPLAFTYLISACKHSVTYNAQIRTLTTVAAEGAVFALP